MDLHDALVVAEKAMDERRKALQPPRAPVAKLKETKPQVRELDAAYNLLRELRALL